MNPESKPYCNYCDEYSDGHNHDNDGPMCICGHYELDHHRSWFRNGYKLVEECEYFGYNETGGMEQNEDGKWVEHCQRFKEAK